MNAENLPEGIIFDILSRLPVVSLCRFRCVSKSWRSLISHPQFIATHLNRNTNNDRHEHLILADYCNSYSVELESSQFGRQSVAVHLNFPQDQFPTCEEICGSCDGLVLMVDIYFTCFLVNPSTRESRELQESPFTINSRYRFAFYTDYGLGYDSSIDDYKVVRICYYDGDAECADNEVSVYALKTNSWRRIESSPHDHSRFGHHSGAFVCGALHWVGSNGTDDVITALGLADENFRTLPSPTPTLGCIDFRLSVLGGCLCVFVEQFHCLDFWVMKEYGVRDSWMKFTVRYVNIYYNSLTPLSLSRTGQVLFNAAGYELVLFDPREEEFKELLVQGRPTRFEVGPYVESLVSPKWQCS